MLHICPPPDTRAPPSRASRCVGSPRYIPRRRLAALVDSTAAAAAAAAAAAMDGSRRHVVKDNTAIAGSWSRLFDSLASLYIAAGGRLLMCL